MAKTQTFGDKMKKKKGDDKVYIKVIKGVPSQKTGALKILQNFVAINDVAEIEKMDFTK